MIGILGGTFDPIHYGHLRLAQEAAENLALASVRFLPAGRPWHRGPPRATGHHRLAMTRLAIADNPLFSVDSREVDENALGHTVETLAALRTELGGALSLCLLVGSDAFVGLTSWYRWQELFTLAHLVVATRPGAPRLPGALPPPLYGEWKRRHVEHPEALARAPAGHILELPITLLDISATRIRADISAGRTARYLAPDAVLDYIHAHGLYR